MQHTHRSPRIRLAIIVAATMLVAGACGSDTVLTSPGAPTTEPNVIADAPASATPPTAAPDPTPTTTVATSPTTADTDATDTAPPTTIEPAPCGEIATEEQGCVQQIATTPHAVADELSLEPVDPPEPTEIEDLASPDDDLLCGPLLPVPVDALIGTEIWVDLDGVGGDDDRIVAYFDDAWKLRAEFSTGAQSELEIPGTGAHGVRVLGFADVDLTYGGEEIMAVVGGGASTVEIGVFSFLEGGCIFRYQADGGGDFSVYSGASVTHGSGVVCGEGYITSWGFERDDDDTYAVWDASFEPISLGVFGYMPSSDGFAEGLSFDDLNPDLFACNGLSL